MKFSFLSLVMFLNHVPFLNFFVSILYYFKWLLFVPHLHNSSLLLNGKQDNIPLSASFNIFLVSIKSLSFGRKE